MLVKYLYGLKQASRQWFKNCTTFLQAQGLTHSHANHTLFTKSISTSFTTLLFYVDDIILACTSLIVFADLKRELDKNFHIKRSWSAKVLPKAQSSTIFQMYHFVPTEVLLRIAQGCESH